MRLEAAGPTVSQHHMIICIVITDPSMNKQHNRPLLIFALLETLRLQSPALHTLIIRAFEPEFLSLHQALIFQGSFGESCDLLYRNVVICWIPSVLQVCQVADYKDVVWRCERRAREDDTTVREGLYPRCCTAFSQCNRFILRRQVRIRRGFVWSWWDGDDEHLDLCFIPGSEVDRPAVFREL